MTPPFPYHDKIEHLLEKSLEEFGPPSRLKEAIAYSLRYGGKRVRPSFVFLIASQLGKGREVSDAAIAVEYFHTASLIADDLPCMDNDDLRRSRPSLHKAFDEATAILTTYALITAGYDRIRMNVKKLEKQGCDQTNTICLLAIEEVSICTGIKGATGGQYEDLFTSHQNEGEILETMRKKTATLFELSFVLGWLFGGGDLDQLNKVKRTAGAFGLAFQLFDDLKDLSQDKLAQGLNYAIRAGEEKAKALLQEEIAFLKQGLQELKLDCPPLIQMIKFFSGH